MKKNASRAPNSSVRIPQSEVRRGGEVRKGYTGYEKDSESGLEFAQARYYNTIHGRFTSVDPLTASASIRNPQTFNRYSYVLNSPYKYTDPLGLLPKPLKDGTKGCNIYGHWYSRDDIDRILRQFAKPPERPATEPAPAAVHEGLHGNQQEAAGAGDSSGQDSLFRRIWRNHPGEGAIYTIDGVVPDGYDNQCAIKLAYALQKAGIDMSSYKGKTVPLKEDGKTMRLAVDAYKLAKWLEANHEKLGSRTFVLHHSATWTREGVSDFTNNDQTARRMFNGSRGIIIFVDFYENKSMGGALRGHVDVWDANRLKAGELHYFYRSKSVLLIEMR